MGLKNCIKGIVIFGVAFCLKIFFAPFISSVWSPDLFLIITLFFGIQKGVGWGMGMGMGFGLIEDVCAPGTHFFSLIIFGCIGYIAGSFRIFLYRISVIISMILAFSISFLANSIHIFVLYLVSGWAERSFGFVSSMILRKALITACITPFVCFMLSKIVKE